MASEPPCVASARVLWSVGTLSVLSEPSLCGVGTRFVESWNLTPFGFYNIKEREVWGWVGHTDEEVNHVLF